jgi:hypothetical protein
MICLNRFFRRNSGHNSFRASAVPGKIMILDIPYADTAVRFRDNARNIHRRPEFCHAHPDTVKRIAVYTPDMPVYFRTREFFHFSGSMPPVAA